MGNLNTNHILTEDLIFKIKSFLCYKELQMQIISKFYERIKKNPFMDSCKIVRYKNTCSCIHDDPNYYDAIRILGDNNRIKLFENNIGVIHFDSLESINFAKPYLEDFGRVFHFCCRGKGAWFVM